MEVPSLHCSGANVASETLHPAVQLVQIDSGTLELRDTRTGLHIHLQGPEVKLGPGATLSRDLVGYLRPAGFLNENLTTEELNRRQRRFRTDLQRRGRDDALVNLVSFASRQVVFYRNSIAYAHLHDIRGTADLVRLPLMWKRDIRLHFHQLLAEGVEYGPRLKDGSLECVRTSGSTDERLQVISDMTLDRVPPCFDDVWGLPYREAPPKTAVLTSPICSATECHLGRATLQERTRHELVLFLNSTDDLFSAPDSLVRNFAEELWTYRPNFIVANPTYLLWFCRRSQQLGLELPPVELVLLSYQYAPRSQRRALAQIFKAPAISMYTASELCGCQLAVECKNGRWHVYEDHCLVELVGRDGNKPDGELGAVAVTTVAGRVMPLLRYVVGDVARFTGEECDCSLSDWQCLEFHGRMHDMLFLGGRWVTTRDVDEVLSYVDGIDFYRCTQADSETLLVDVIATPGLQVDQSQVRQSLRSRLPVDTVHVRTVSRLDPAPSMKFPLTCCLAEAKPAFL